MGKSLGFNVLILLPEWIYETPSDRELSMLDEDRERDTQTHRHIIYRGEA